MWKPVEPDSWNDSVFRRVGADWMLVTAGNLQHFNTMTASWGSLGILWNMPVATIYVRPTRFTDSFVKRYEQFSLSFFKEEHREALSVCGRLSGRDVDKVAVSGLSPLKLKDGSVTFKEAELVFSCVKLYSDKFDESKFLDRRIHKHYPKGDIHNIYIGEIVGIFKQVGQI